MELIERAPEIVAVVELPDGLEEQVGFFKPLDGYRHPSGGDPLDIDHKDTRAYANVKDPVKFADWLRSHVDAGGGSYLQDHRAELTEGNEWQIAMPSHYVAGDGKEKPSIAFISQMDTGERKASGFLGKFRNPVSTITMLRGYVGTIPERFSAPPGENMIIIAKKKDS